MPNAEASPWSSSRSRPRLIFAAADTIQRLRRTKYLEHSHNPPKPAGRINRRSRYRLIFAASAASESKRRSRHRLIFAAAAVDTIKRLSRPKYLDHLHMCL